MLQPFSEVIFLVVSCVVKPGSLSLYVCIHISAHARRHAYTHTDRHACLHAGQLTYLHRYVRIVDDRETLQLHVKCIHKTCNLCMYVCMYVRMYACMDVSMYA